MKWGDRDKASFFLSGEDTGMYSWDARHLAQIETLVLLLLALHGEIKLWGLRGSAENSSQMQKPSQNHHQNPIVKCPFLGTVGVVQPAVPLGISSER